MYVQVYTCNYLVTEGARKVQESLMCSEKEQWKDAKQKEMNSIYSNDIWDLVELPKDCKPVGKLWLFKRKTNADGSIDRYKAQLVAQGFSQQQGCDYDETFSPVISLRVFIPWLQVLLRRGSNTWSVYWNTAFMVWSKVLDVGIIRSIVIWRVWVLLMIHASTLPQKEKIFS